MKPPDRSTEREAIPLRERIALRISEAAALVGLSENAFRDYILPRCPKFYAGRSLRIPRSPFEEFVQHLAQEEGEHEEATAEELLRAVEIE